MSDAITINHLIANQEVEGASYFDDMDPGMKDSCVAKVASGSKEIFDQAARAAAEAQRDWAALPFGKRKGMLASLLGVVEAEMKDLPPLEIREAGHEFGAAMADLGMTMALLGHQLEIIDGYMQPAIIEDETSWTRIDKVPKGVVTVISPWNMPIGLAMAKIAPALFAGNTVVVKPPSDAPAALTTLLGRCAQQLPPGVINVVNGTASQLSQAIIDNEDVRVIGFTGGTQGGKELYAGCAKTMKSGVFELSGNDAAIILDDADVDAAIPQLVRSAFMRAGQICFAAKRIYVPASMCDEFYEKMCDAVNELKVGYGLNPESSYGPVMNERQYTYVLGLIEEAKASGSEVRELGSKSTPELWDNGYYILPHVIKAVSNDISIVAKEQFGPAMPIVAYEGVDQAVAFANDCNLGLCSSVWARDTDHGVQVAEQIQAGQTFINGHTLESLAMGVPFGGVKNSGVGRDFAGAISLDEYIDYHPIRIMK